MFLNFASWEELAVMLWWIPVLIVSGFEGDFLYVLSHISIAFIRNMTMSSLTNTCKFTQYISLPDKAFAVCYRNEFFPSRERDIMNPYAC